MRAGAEKRRASAMNAWKFSLSAHTNVRRAAQTVLNLWAEL
jgi:hypothetical protein